MHEKVGGQTTLIDPPLEKVGGQLTPLTPCFRGLCTFAYRLRSALISLLFDYVTWKIVDRIIWRPSRAHVRTAADG